MLPSGTVSFLFTDIEGSTQLVLQHPDSASLLLARHHSILQSAIEAHGGYVFQIIGDAFCAAFQTVLQALDAALEIQHALTAEDWAPVPIKVRIGIHTGPATLKTEAGSPAGYSGYLSLARAQHVMSVAYGGQILLSNSTAELVRADLPSDVDLRDLGPNRLKSTPIPENLWQVLAPGLRHDFPPLASLTSVPNNLPLQMTSFVGREHELGELRTLLHDHRLTTLTGSGGTGKTRLSLQVAAQVLDTFKNGVWFIELAPLSDPALVPSTIASVLGVRDEHRPLTATLLDWLRNRNLLLILDNCEHLIEAVAEFADAALHAGPETRILATSREALGIAGEACYRVPSLGCPELSQAGEMHPEELANYPAVQLFVERATQSLTTFRATQANSPAIIEICHRLDGIPLAIELAAARVKALHVDEIAARLDDRFRLLTNGNRTALRRHQTLGSLIDWSHNLLSAPERALFRRLSVFSGGWALEAAEEVCASDAVQSPEILGLLMRLTEKSLIVFDENAAVPRYRMLETIREYARGRLLEAQEGNRIRDQHLRYFVALAESTRPLLESRERAEWLPRLELDHDNLLAALDWAGERDPETARWLAGILERFWFYGDHLGEARTWYGRLLFDAERTPVTRGLALGLLGSGCVAFNLELMDEAQGLFEESVALWRQLGDPSLLAWTLGWLGYLLLQRGEAARADAIYTENESLFRASGGDLTLVWVLSSWGTVKSALRRDDPRAKSLLDEALALAQTMQDPFGFEMCYSSLGDWAMLHTDYAAARGYFLEALKWRQELGTRWILAAGYWQVASIMRLLGDYREAEPMYAEALTLARDLGDQRSMAHLSQELGAVAIHLGDAERAAVLLNESLASYRKLADALGIARCLLGFADLRSAQGQTQATARLLGFLEAWQQANTIQLLHFDRANFERIVAAARPELGETSFTESRDAGGKLSLEEAIALAVN